MDFCIYIYIYINIFLLSILEKRGEFNKYLWVKGRNQITIYFDFTIFTAIALQFYSIRIGYFILFYIVHPFHFFVAGKIVFLLYKMGIESVFEIMDDKFININIVIATFKKNILQLQSMKFKIYINSKTKILYNYIYILLKI